MEIRVYQEEPRYFLLSFSQRQGTSPSTDLGIAVPQIGHEFKSSGLHYIVKRVIWHIGYGIPNIEVLCERL